MDMKSTSQAMETEKIPRLLAQLAIPAVVAQIINLLYNIVDRIYIGHISGVGAAALTGVGLFTPILMLINAFAMLAGSGGAPRAAISMGKKDNKTAEKILGNCFISLVIVALIITIIVLIFNEPLLYLFGASENTIGYARSYICIYAIGTISVMVTLGLNAFISAQGFSKISMLTVLIGAVTNIVLDPIFIFVFNMGVNGAAWATIISQTISAIWAFQFLLSKKTVLRLRKDCMKIEKDILVPCIGLGVAPFIMQSTESVLVLCFNSSLLAYGGDLAVGAMTILSSVMQFAMLPLQGMTQGGQPIISYNYGAEKLDRVKSAFKLQLMACFIYALALWLLAMFVPSLFAMIFTSDPDLVEITSWALRIYLFAIPMMGIQVACQQTFIAFGNSKTSAFLAIFRKLIVLIPLIYILPMILTDKVFAVFLAEPIADTIASVTTATLFYISLKKMIRTKNQG